MDEKEKWVSVDIKLNLPILRRIRKRIISFMALFNLSIGLWNILFPINFTTTLGGLMFLTMGLISVDLIRIYKREETSQKKGWDNG